MNPDGNDESNKRVLLGIFQRGTAYRLPQLVQEYPDRASLAVKNSAATRAGRSYYATVLLLDFLDLGWPPFLSEKGFKRAVQPQDGKPAFFRISLNPVSTLHSSRLSGAEIDCG
jgi:hypothetical protein